MSVLNLLGEKKGHMASLREWNLLVLHLCFHHGLKANLLLSVQIEDDQG